MALISNLTTPNNETFDIRAGAIPYGTVDSTSTSTVFTATVPGITALTDGTTVMLKNGVVTSASNFTINVNGLGAKPCYTNLAAATRDTTIFNVNYTMLFVYDEDRVSGGCWICYRGYDANTNTIGYQLRTNSTVMNVSDTARYYKIYFTSADGTKWVPASVNSTNNATSKRDVNQRPIDPFGRIVYQSANTNFAAGANLTATSIWDQYNLTLGYSFNRTGAALTLTAEAPVYIKCAPQSNGSAIMDATTPYVQTLPTSADGKIYIFLGVATSATAVELVINHPVYYHDGNGIKLWTGAAIPTKTSDLTNDSGFITSAGAPVQSVNGKTGAVTIAIPAYTSDLENDSGYISSGDGALNISVDGTSYPIVGWQKQTVSGIEGVILWYGINDSYIFLPDGVGFNTGVQSILSQVSNNYVPNIRTVNNKALSSDITLDASDIGALPDTTSIPSKTSDLTNDSGFLTSDSIVVGTRNYILNSQPYMNPGSATTEQNYSWFTSNSSMTHGITAGEYFYCTNVNSVANNERFQLQKHNYYEGNHYAGFDVSSFSDGDPITFSCDVKSSSPFDWHFNFNTAATSSSTTIQVGGADTRATVNTGGNWTRIYYTGTIPTGFSSAMSGTPYTSRLLLACYFSTANQTIYIRNLKMDKGNVKTDWLPNEADFLAQALLVHS